MKYVALVASFFLSACQISAPVMERDEGWTLTFSDEFDGTGKPDASKWQSESYNRRKNAEGPDGWWDPDYVALDGAGHLVLSVAQIPNRNPDEDNDPHDFASGMVSTKGLFEQRYGRFETRAKLPREAGWWAAFWLFSQSTNNVDGSGQDGTEIDIMEGFGGTDRTQHALHWDGYGEAHQIEEHKFEWPGLSEGFHIFAVEWSPTEYIFFIDGQETWRTDAGGVSQVPAYVKVTGEISTESWAIKDNWAGTPDPANYPDDYIIDYVRIWSR